MRTLTSDRIRSFFQYLSATFLPHLSGKEEEKICLNVFNSWRQSWGAADLLEKTDNIWVFTPWSTGRVPLSHDFLCKGGKGLGRVMATILAGEEVACENNLEIFDAWEKKLDIDRKKRGKVSPGLDYRYSIFNRWASLEKFDLCKAGENGKKKSYFSGKIVASCWMTENFLHQVFDNRGESKAIFLKKFLSLFYDKRAWGNSIASWIFLLKEKM